MIRRLLIVLQIFIVVFVISGFGIFAQPTPAQAALTHSNEEATVVVGGGLLGLAVLGQGITIGEAITSWTLVGPTADKIFTTVYKGIVLPLVRQSILQWAAGQSDFPFFLLNPVNFLDYIAGTALDSFFYDLLGIRICDGIQINIKLAIALLFFFSPLRLDFGFKGCKLSKIIANSKFNFEWSAQIGLFQEPAASDIGYYFIGADEARVAVGQAHNSILSDLFASGGALSMQDCSGDLNGNNKKGEKPVDCRVTTPGGILEKYLEESVTGSDKATKSSTYLADATALGVEAYAVYINTFMLKKLQSLAGSKSTGGALKYNF